ncbi:sensor histidine kinase [Clostridium tunisiense]|uniref:sensor histidine kinase n=1 Tax=Clostridium tunisiense TaxID=219748 RepID=UPI000A075F6A|nr:PAS domain-containing sensor histidine kinase [Clostridium tunisiense]
MDFKLVNLYINNKLLIVITMDRVMTMGYEDLTKDQLIKHIKSKDEKISDLEKLVREQEKTLKALTLSESTMRAVIESSIDGIIVKDENFNITNINRSFMKIWELDEECFNQIDRFELVEHCKKKVVNPMEFAENLDVITRENKEHWDYIYFKNGKVIEQLFEPLIVNGEIRGNLWSFRDITKRKKLEKSLETSEELYKRLINKLPDGILVYENGKRIIANEAALNFSAKKLKSYNIGESLKIHPEYRQVVDERISKLLNEETEVDFLEQKILLDDGTEGEVEVAGFSFKEEDSLYVTAIIRDIADRKRIHKLEMDILEKSILLSHAEEYSRLKTQLFSTVSHELKTPLNIILGGIQLLQDKLEKNPNDANIGFSISSVGKYLRSMKQNCYRLLRLINNFIDMNKIESGFFKLDLENKNIIEIIENITLSVVSYVESKEISIIFDTEVEEKIIACDEDKLERVILNLLSNAIKFTNPGGNIQVNIYDRGNSLIVSVKDSGFGIPKDMHSKVFEPFTQGDSLLRRRAEGSGIGLSLVKSLVELHGGKVSVDSELGKGSEFIIELPINLIEESKDCVDRGDFIGSKVEKITVEFSDIYV